MEICLLCLHGILVIYCRSLQYNKIFKTKYDEYELAYDAIKIEQENQNL